MQTHHYHPETGAYLGQGRADADPLEAGAWLVPAHATTEQPPAIAEGQELFNLGGAWVLRDKPAPQPEAAPVPPAPEPTDAQRRTWDIRGRLGQIDEESIRALRAVARGRAVKADTDKLDALDAEAAALRAELVALA